MTAKNFEMIKKITAIGTEIGRKIKKNAYKIQGHSSTPSIPNIKINIGLIIKKPIFKNSYSKILYLVHK